jgi:hypothetical protein
MEIRLVVSEVMKVGRFGTVAISLTLMAIVVWTVVALAVPERGGDTTTVAEPRSAPSATPTKACVVPESEDPPGECVPVDIDDYMRSNHAFRDRMEPGAEAARTAESALPMITAALEPLADGDGVSRADVLDALLGAGFDSRDIQIMPFSDDDSEQLPSLAIAVDVGGACVSGGIRTGMDAPADASTGVDFEVGGYIADGGCLPAN